MGEEQQQEGSRKPQEAFVMALWGLWLMVSIVIIAWYLIAWIIRIISVIAWMAMLDVCLWL
jgi:Flp pilus assembly protein TadB